MIDWRDVVERTALPDIEAQLRANSDIDISVDFLPDMHTTADTLELNANRTVNPAADRLRRALEEAGLVSIDIGSRVLELGPFLIDAGLKNNRDERH